MATQVLSKPRYVKNLQALPPPAIIDGNTYKFCIETASQTYDAGDLVYIDSNGTIAIATTSSGSQNSSLLGIAARDATGTTGAVAYVYPFRPGDVYAFNLFHTTAASAVGTQTRYGETYGIYYDTAAAPTGTGGAWCVDLITTTLEDATTAVKKVMVMDAPDRGFDGAANVIGDIYAVVHCIIVPWSRATDGVPHANNMQLFYGT